MAAKKITGKFDSIEAVLRDIARGKMVVVVDDADRENEGDLIMAAEKTTAKADVAYLRESILDPTAKVVKGFEKGEYAMPSYAGVMSDSQIESLILFIKAVKGGDPEAVAAAKGKKEDPCSFE